MFLVPLGIGSHLRSWDVEEQKNYRNELGEIL